MRYRPSSAEMNNGQWFISYLKVLIGLQSNKQILLSFSLSIANKHFIPSHESFIDDWLFFFQSWNDTTLFLYHSLIHSYSVAKRFSNKLNSIFNSISNSRRLTYSNIVIVQAPRSTAERGMSVSMREWRRGKLASSFYLFQFLTFNFSALNRDSIKLSIAF